MRCAKCNQTLERLMFFALLIDCGARASQSPIRCPAGGEHDFAAVPDGSDGEVSRDE